MELVISEKDEQMPELFDLDTEQKKWKEEKKINSDLVDKVVDQFEGLKDPLEQKEQEETVEGTRQAQIDPIDIVNKEAKDVTDAETALTATKAKGVAGGNNEFADQPAKDAQIKIDEAKVVQEKIDLRIVDSNLARWTRMDLFPGITREIVYPRTVHQRTERKDFLAKGMGKVYPFGNKNQFQMSGSGGAASDVIKLKRLYGRYKIAKNDGTEEVQPRKMGRLNPLT